jgi:hypothetical protein
VTLLGAANQRWSKSRGGKRHKDLSEFVPHSSRHFVSQGIGRIFEGSGVRPLRPLRLFRLFVPQGMMETLGMNVGWTGLSDVAVLRLCKLRGLSNEGAAHSVPD